MPSSRAGSDTPKTVRRIGLAILVLAALFLATFAIPIREWRTGEIAVPPLPLTGGRFFKLPAERLWIDTDAACGIKRNVDVDDCFALLLLARSGMHIAGVSTVFGNAPLDVTDQTTRELIAMVGSGALKPPPVYAGSATPLSDRGLATPSPAYAALHSALRQGPLTIVALGPLTNIAACLKDHPDLRNNVAGIVAVMGHRRGHLFHPAEGKGRSGFLFGHGPVFRDFNFACDRAAVGSLMERHLPITTVPYDAAREISLDAADLDRMSAAGGPAGWVASRSRGWLEYWKGQVGLKGFYPFDLLAAAFVIEPGFFNCAKVDAWVARDPMFRWLPSPDSLIVGLHQERPRDISARAEVVYCPGIDSKLHDWLVDRLLK